jgi:acyl carrier protein
MTTAEAIAMLESAFSEPAGSMGPATARDSVGGWDSMGALVLMAELDERFGILLTPEKSKTFTQVSDVLALLKSHNVLTD